MDLTPKQIVEKLDSYIIGQNEAKKAVGKICAWATACHP